MGAARKINKINTFFVQPEKNVISTEVIKRGSRAYWWARIRHFAPQQMEKDPSSARHVLEALVKRIFDLDTGKAKMVQECQKYWNRENIRKHAPVKLVTGASYSHTSSADVALRTKTGALKRSIHRLCPLPFDYTSVMPYFWKRLPRGTMLGLSLLDLRKKRKMKWVCISLRD